MLTSGGLAALLQNEQLPNAMPAQSHGVVTARNNTPVLTQLLNKLPYQDWTNLSHLLMYLSVAI